jgi:hypothetical protein
LRLKSRSLTSLIILCQTVFFQIALSGCATIFIGSSQQLKIESIPSGALVALSNGLDCQTPCNIKVKRDKALSLDFTYQGYEPVRVQVIPVPSEAGLAYGGLLDFGTGASYALSPNPVIVSLVQK